MPSSRRVGRWACTLSIQDTHPCKHNSFCYYDVMSPTGPTHRKRCKRFDVAGHAHFLTFSCFNQRPFFPGNHAHQWFLDALDSARTRRPFHLWAFVIMPEHVHLLVLPHEGVCVSDILSAVKLPVTRRAITWATCHNPDALKHMLDVQPSGKRHQRFWQRGGGYDRNVKTIAEAHEKIHYIHANPVRRGLVEHPQDWPWSSWRAWEYDTDDPIRLDRDTLGALEML